MIIDKLNSILNSTDEGSLRHQIAKTIKYNINNMSSLSIGELADECHVSKSMISKFSKELGYESFIDLKDDCQSYYQYRQNVPLLEYDKTFQESCYSYIEEVHNVMLESIQDLNLRDLYKLTQQIYQAQCLYLYGNEKDHLVCQKFQKDLDHFDKLTTILDYDLSDDYQMKSPSLFIIFYTCDTHYMNSQIIKKILKHNQPVWLITTKEIDNPALNILKLPHSQLTIDNNLLYMFIDMMISSYSQYKRKVHKS
ncbi:MAG: hypothetical protein RR585_13460 [Coprobacillus sp.]